MSTIIEIGPSTLPNIFPSKQIFNIQSNELSKLPKFLKHKDLFFVAINTTPFNGSTVKLIKDIRKEYNGPILVFVAKVDSKICGKFLEAGASDIIFEYDINKANIEQLLERYWLKSSADKTLQEIRLGLSKIPAIK